MRYPSTKSQGIIYFFALLFLAFVVQSFYSNPPDGKTGAPGDGLCTECHTPGNPEGLDGSISIDGLPSSISPGMTYTITLSSMNPNGLADRAGFQMVVLDEDNNDAGDLSNPSPNTAITPFAGRTYFEHEPAADFPPSNEVSWNVDWTAPSLPNGTEITIYAANNISNGNMASSGDYIVTNTASGTIMGSTLEVDITATSDVSCFGGTDGSATAEASGGSPPYTYDWSNGDSGPMLTNVPAGMYTVTVTDSESNTATATASISEPDELILTVTNSTNVSCNGGSDGSATVNATGGTGPYTYNWSNGGSGNTQNNLMAGSYTITVTDNNGCTETIGALIEEPPPLSITTLTIEDVSCAGGSDGLINVEAGGGTAPYAYAWSNGATGPVNTNLSAGSHNLTVTDDNGCTETMNFTIDEPPILNISLDASQDVSCFGGSDGSATVSASGGTTPYAFDWSDGNTGNTNSNLSAGAYSVTVTDGNDCTNTLVVMIEEPDELTVTTSATNETSEGAEDGTATAMANGGTPPYSYMWSNGDSGPMIDSLPPGSYIVTVTDENDCTATATATVESFDCPLTVSIGVEDSISCYGQQDGALTATAMNGPNPTFSWSNGGTDSTITGLVAGTYSVTVTDDNNCTATAVFSLNQPDSITISITTEDESANDANDGTATASASGGTPPYSYVWSNGESGPMIDSLSPGTYIVTVTDDNGCTNTATAVINPFGCNLAIEIMQNADIFCFGDSTAELEVVITEGGPPNTIEWSTGDATPTISGRPAGMYSVTVTDDDGCVANASIDITQPDALDLSVFTTDETANNENDGTAVATVTGGSPPYTYLWSTGAMTDSIGDLSPGTYSVTVTDENGCTAVASGVVNPFGCALNLTAETRDPLCADSGDGEICVITSGGSPPYTYEWSTGTSTDSCLSDLGDGTFAITVMDADNCTVTDTFTLDAPDSLKVTLVEVMGSDEGESNGSIAIDVSGGTAPYEFEWYLNDELVSTDEDPMDLAAGMYELELVDDNGCSILFGPVEVPMEVATIDPGAKIVFEYYPNPSRGLINIKSDRPMQQVVLMGLHGQQKIRKKPSNGNEFTLNTTALAEGMYLLQVQWRNGMHKMVKVVKQ